MMLWWVVMGAILVVLLVIILCGHLCPRVVPGTTVLKTAVDLYGNHGSDVIVALKQLVAGSYRVSMLVYSTAGNMLKDALEFTTGPNIWQTKPNPAFTLATRKGDVVILGGQEATAFIELRRMEGSTVYKPGR